MGSSSIEAGKAFLRLLVDDKDFAKGLEAGLQKLESFSKSAVKIGAQLGGVGAAITGPLIGAVAVFSEVGSALNDMSDRTGVSVEMLSKLKFAAEQSGASLDDVERALRFMAKNGKDVNTFGAVAKQIAAISDPSKRAAAAIAEFGKSGTSLLPMAASLDELLSKADQLDVTMSTKAAKSADALGDAIDSLKSQFVAVAVAVGEAVAPAVTGLVEGLSTVLPIVIEFIKHNRSLFVAASAVGGALVGLGGVLAVIGTVGLVASHSIKALSAALVALEANPWAVVITLALVALSAALSPLLEQWAGTALATDKAADSAKSHTKAIDAQTESIKKGNKALEERAAAFARLTGDEQKSVAFNEEIKKQQAEEKRLADLRVQAIDEEIRANRERFDTLSTLIGEAQARHQRLVGEKAEGGSSGFQRKVDEATRDNQEELQRLRDEQQKLIDRSQTLKQQRDELTGEGAKKRAEEQKKLDEQIAENKKQLAEKLAEQEKQRDEQRRKHEESVASAAASITSQFQGFSRPTIGTFSGRLAGQIFGTSIAEGREEKQLRISADQLMELREINQKLDRGGLLVGNG